VQLISRRPGYIAIPAISFAQLGDLLTGRHMRLTDILRHEWAHALADVHPGQWRREATRRDGDRRFSPSEPSELLTAHQAFLPGDQTRGVLYTAAAEF
jgi:hypothetical protein